MSHFDLEGNREVNIDCQILTGKMLRCFSPFQSNYVKRSEHSMRTAWDPRLAFAIGKGREGNSCWIQLWLFVSVLLVINAVKFSAVWMNHCLCQIRVVLLHQHGDVQGFYITAAPSSSVCNKFIMKILSPSEPPVIRKCNKTTVLLNASSRFVQRCWLMSLKQQLGQSSSCEADHTGLH